MTARINTALENNPALGWIGSLGSTLLGLLQWFIDHADAFVKFTGLVAALFGVAAGYYTFRLQRRAWKRAQREDRPLD